MPTQGIRLRIENSSMRRTVSDEDGEAIVRAVLTALRVPISALIKEVVIGTAETAYGTYTELIVVHQSSKVERKIRLSYATAQRVNAALTQLENDGFHPEVRQELRENLMQILRKDLDSGSR